MGATCCSQDAAPKVEAVQVDQQSFSADDTLAMTFRTNTSPDSAKLVVKFKKGPLGMSFNQKAMPMVIKSVTEGGEAGILGVQAGMMIEKIGDEDISETTYEDAFALMRSMVEKLPKA
mmetsp:Transcript_28369/g.54681  ORF Transcript_28369/g.54681 Transcript_28369/m.54681 type:complete len:118 (-) Transcript_28369:226-579(-)